MEDQNQYPDTDNYHQSSQQQQQQFGNYQTYQNQYSQQYPQQPPQQYPQHPPEYHDPNSYSTHYYQPHFSSSSNSPIIAKRSDTSKPHPLEFMSDHPEEIHNPKASSPLVGKSNPSPSTQSLITSTTSTTSTSSTSPSSIFPISISDNTTMNRSSSYTTKPKKPNYYDQNFTTSSSLHKPKEYNSLSISLDSENPDTQRKIDKHVHSSSKIPNQIKRGRSATIVPTTKNIKGEWKGAGIGVGAGVGCAIGLVVGGIIGFVVLGGVGAAVGRTIGKKQGMSKEKKFLATQDLTQLKTFEKPIKAKSQRCKLCSKRFGPFVKRSHCSLCGQSHCQIHIPKRAYILFAGETLLKCSKVCIECWNENMPDNEDEVQTKIIDIDETDEIRKSPEIQM